MYGSTRHAHRTLDNDDIFFLRINICLLVSIRSIALPGRHKTRGNLHTLCAHRKIVFHILAFIYAASHDYRNLQFISKFNNGLNFIIIVFLIGHCICINFFLGKT